MRQESQQKLQVTQKSQIERLARAIDTQIYQSRKIFTERNSLQPVQQQMLNQVIRNKMEENEKSRSRSPSPLDQYSPPKQFNSEMKGLKSIMKDSQGMINDSLKMIPIKYKANLHKTHMNTIRNTQKSIQSIKGLQSLSGMNTIAKCPIPLMTGCLL